MAQFGVMPVPYQAQDKLQWASLMEQKRIIWILNETLRDYRLEGSLTSLRPASRE